MACVHSLRLHVACRAAGRPGRAVARAAAARGSRQRPTRARRGSLAAAAHHSPLDTATPAALAFADTQAAAAGARAGVQHLAGPVFELAALDPATAAAAGSALGPLLSVGTLFFVVRIVMTWYPNIKDDAFPWSLVYYPTEPLLAPTRKLITPVGGVDVSPIVWVAALSFLSEILLGKQGLLVLLASKQS